MTTPRVLIVDDSDDQRGLLCRMVTLLGFEATACEDGSLALEELKHNTFDLVISDIQMPNGDGLWLLRSIRDLGVHTSVVLISANIKFDSVDIALLGADGFLKKPFTVHQLKATISQVLKQL